MSREPNADQDPGEDLDLLRDMIARHEQVSATQRTQQELEQRRRREELEQARHQAALAQADADQWKARLVAAQAQAQTTPLPPAGQTARTQRAVRHKETALVSGATVDRAAIGVMRYGALGLLTISFVGSIVAFNTGWPLRSGWAPIIAAWPQPWEGVSPWAPVVGVALHGWLTLVQWHKRHEKRSLLYLSHLGVDAALTFAGYVPVLGPLFAAGLAKLGAPAPWDTRASWAIVAVLAVIVAKVAEELLVDD
jgi:hypothetical protein